MKRTRYIRMLIFLLPCRLFSQETLVIHHGCNFNGEETEKTYYEFDASREADSIVGQILNAVSLEKNFVIKSSNCSNALATFENGQRYILYNTTFLEQFKRDTRWAAWSVFAHEIGHHLQGHDFAETDPVKRKKMELEADKFSGGVLRMLGACLEDAQAGVSTFALAGETATHPSGAARREAVASGWKKKDEQLNAPCNGGAQAPVKTAALETVSAALWADVTQYEDKLKNIIRFLPRAEQIFEYPERMKEYNGYIKSYNEARDNALKNRPTITSQYNTLFARDEHARTVLGDWYKTALDNIHDRYILSLDDQVQQLFKDVSAEKISPAKARKTLHQNWSAESPFYKALQKSMTDMEDTRRQLSGLLKH